MSNGNEITKVEATKPLTAAEVKAHVQLIQQVMEAVMIPKTHYDTIAGCGGIFTGPYRRGNDKKGENK